MSCKQFKIRQFIVNSQKTSKPEEKYDNYSEVSYIYDEYVSQSKRNEFYDTEEGKCVIRKDSFKNE